MAMEIEIEEKRVNPLLYRKEVRFVVIHDGEGTPSRAIVKEELAKKLKEKKENMIIDYIRSHFGSQRSIGYAKVYKSLDDAKKIEPKYIIKRNLEEKEKKEREIKGEVEKSEEKEVTEQPEVKEVTEQSEEKDETGNKEEEKQTENAEESKEEKKE